MDVIGQVTRPVGQSEHPGHSLNSIIYYYILCKTATTFLSLFIIRAMSEIIYSNLSEIVYFNNAISTRI